MARRSSIARIPLGRLLQGEGEVEDLPGSMRRSTIRSIRSGRKRRTGAGPPPIWTCE